MEAKQLHVAALENGTVIDHIPAEALFQVAKILDLEQLKNSVTIGNNLPSHRMGTKGIIKIANMTLPDETLNRIALVAPKADISNIQGYKVVSKHQVSLPDELVGLVECPNPKCITNNEPVTSRFEVVNRENVKLKCHYCGTEVTEPSK